MYGNLGDIMNYYGIYIYIGSLHLEKNDPFFLSMELISLCLSMLFLV